MTEAVAGAVQGADNGGQQQTQTTDGGQQQQAAADWTAGLNDELKGYVQNKGFKDPAAALESYRNLEKLLGAPQENILKLPAKEDDAEGWSKVWERLGRPADPKDYEIQVPEGIGDDKFAEWARNAFHELNMPKGMASKLVAKWNDYVKSTLEQQQTQYQSQVQQDGDKLKSEWGAAYEQNVNVAKRAAQTFGVDAETIDKMEKALGFAGVMRLFHTIGSKMGEDAFVTGDKGNPGFGVMTPEAAKSRIAALRNDKDFIKRFTNGDIQAKQEWEQLHKWAVAAG